MALVNVKLQYRHRGASLNENGYNCGEKSLSVVIVETWVVGNLPRIPKTRHNSSKKRHVLFSFKNNYERLLNYKNRNIPPLALETALFLVGCCKKC